MSSIFELFGLTGKKIKVTPNVKHCFEIFEEAIASIPAGETKQEAISALDYLRKAAEGEKQPMKGLTCGLMRVFPDFSEKEIS
ncbi:MAG: hypothetical protein KAW12_05515 [Candidatus Aminicenantes bacterium]|nr:hypothetical protein [Candidatus Aminicenantes bacterium]